MAGVEMNTKSTVWLLLLWCFALPAGCTNLAPQHLLGEMPEAELQVDDRRFTVRVADTAATRAGGFQYVPASRMDIEAIYFQFGRPLWPSFHMHNVVAPLLIAWIDGEGLVIGVDLMAPGNAGYRPPAPIVAAIEFTGAHPLAAHLREGAKVTLTQPAIRAGSSRSNR